MHGWRLNFLTGQNNRFYPLTEVSLHNLTDSKCQELATQKWQTHCLTQESTKQGWGSAVTLVFSYEKAVLIYLMKASNWDCCKKNQKQTNKQTKSETDVNYFIT